MADYRGYVTAAGQQFEALAKQMHYPVKIGFIEIGDGALPDNESPISRTSLVHKTKQFPAIVEQDPDRPGEWIAKCHIPADDAINGQGYFIREMGCKLVDQGDGVLYAYRRISNDWKPLITEGEAKSFIYILRFIPSNGELIKPTINPSVVYVDKLEQERRFRQHGAEESPHPQYAKIADIADGLVPVGAVFPWPTSIPPDGWLKCNGAAFDKAQYPKLAQAYPSGYLPDLRGEFIRGYDDGRGVNAGAQLLTPQGATAITDFHGDGALIAGAGAPPRNYFINEDSSMSGPSGFTAFGDKAINKDGVAKYFSVRPRCIPFNFITRKA